MKTITFFNNKGGVGKTTLAVNLASYFALKKNQRVLFLDIDPQANSTQLIVPEVLWNEFYGENPFCKTILDFLSPIQVGDSNLDLTPRPFRAAEDRFGIFLIPGHPHLSIVEDILSDSWNRTLAGDIGGFRRTNWLKSLTNHFDNDYDFLFIDAGPSLGALNRSVLLNSDFFVAPMGSDIFSLMGISNISIWIKKWINAYSNALSVLESQQEDSAVKISKYPLNFDVNCTTRLIGFSIQQYITKTFKGGRRPVASFERIIKQMPAAMTKHLGFLVHNNLTTDDLNLGDVPYLYSLVPLAQSANAPMFTLTYSDGVVGNQIDSVKKYEIMLDSIANKILRNIGEHNADTMA